MLAMEKMTVAAGQDLIRQGEPGNAFYIIEDGEFDIVIDGNRVATFRRGGSFGEVALVREQPRAATVTALTNSICWRLERRNLLCIFFNHLHIHSAVLLPPQSYSESTLRALWH